MYGVVTYIMKVGNYTFNQINAVEINRSIDDLSDTATLKMPTSFLLGNKEEGFERKEIVGNIKAGDKVIFTLGYEDIYEGVEFVGYVKNIKPSIPLEIECEDAIYLIRKKNCNKNFQKTTLKEVLDYIVEGTGVQLSGDVPDVNFDKFLLKNINGAQALEKIKDEYGLTVYIDNEQKLFAGLRQQQGTGTPVIYCLKSDNKQENTIADDLKFRTEDSVSLKVKAIAHQKDNTTIEVEVGDTAGELRTLHFYNISDKEQLKQIATDKLKELKYDGYEGSISAFLVPFADRGMATKVKDTKYPSREGNYLIEKVKVTSGVNGARRTVYLGNKL